MPDYILAIDQGTSSSRAIIFDSAGKPVGKHQLAFQQYFPQDGWVEHDVEAIWQTVLDAIDGALAKAKLNIVDITAIGITNQRETTVIWDKETGKAIYRAIVWQDRRTAGLCKTLSADGLEKIVRLKTGLLLDPYFSATKIMWLLEHVPGAKQKAEQGKLAFGTLDSFLLWRLTGGQKHVTDVTNASRTMLFNIQHCEWDEELLQRFNIPIELLPEVLENAAEFGITDTKILGAAIPITGVAGDQQAASIGQLCFQPGMTKVTYGTGAFLITNTGEKPIVSKHRLLSTIAYKLNNRTHYALEGSIFTAGAGIQWLRDSLKLIDDAAKSEALANSVDDNGGVYLVPAFTGLGAPYWDPQARAAILGLTRGSQPAHVVRAMLEAVCYQTRDLLTAIVEDGSPQPHALRVDGGMVVNNWLMQFLANMLQIPVERPMINETTALGAALLAGLGAGIYQSLDELTKLWELEHTFQPEMNKAQVDALYDSWLAAVNLLARSR